MLQRYIAITEAALDEAVMHRFFAEDGLPLASADGALISRVITDDVLAVCTPHEPSNPYVAIIRLEALHMLIASCNGSFGDIYSRIVRVVKAFKSPPIHLPRHWSEYHYKNLISFFALPKGAAEYRWIVDTNGGALWVRFDSVTTTAKQVDLTTFQPAAWPSDLDGLAAFFEGARGANQVSAKPEQIVKEVDLTTIGSGSVVSNRSFDDWLKLLTADQKGILDAPSNHSMRIIGPAGSGKTLALCLRAFNIARAEESSGQAKKVLVVTHSWAMAERIIGVFDTLGGGQVPSQLTVLPLLYLLQLHAGQSGAGAVQMIGDDSKEGRVAALSLIQEVIGEEAAALKGRSELSPWLVRSLEATADTKVVADLALNFYDEFSGVLAAEGVAVDDPESIRKYMSGTREDWMPPFATTADRRVVIQVYRRFLTKLVDRASITTDQFVSDAIRVLETFTWRMRRETEGYDFIFVDELQLFDSQERLAIELLGRSRLGVPFVTAEDPSQGVFAPLHRRQASGGVNTSVYLDAVHRFDKSIFDLVRFIYQKFPLNTIPLRIDPKKGSAISLPIAHLCPDDESALHKATDIAAGTVAGLSGEGRLCVITLGDVDDELAASLAARSVQVVQLKGFDDVERLSYTKRSVIVAPWQFIGGTQFSNVIVVVAGVGSVNTGFGRLRELTGLYLACSRAAVRLDVVCGVHVPSIIGEAITASLLEERRIH